MKRQHLTILAVSFILLAAVACLFFCGEPRSGTTGPLDPLEKHTGATKPAQEQVVNNAPSPSGQGKGTDRFFEDVGPMRYPLDLDRKTVFDRINTVRAKLVIQVQILPDARVESIADAYRRLMSGAFFISGTEPSWGVEDSEYFYFSGRRQKQPSADAFIYGHAVKKDNGRIYMWASDAR